MQTYLQGAWFSVYTDHRPLTVLFTKQIKYTKVIRWKVFLSEFDGEITYIQGSKTFVAVVLSRQVEPLPSVPNIWLPVCTYDTIQYIHPDTLDGDSCVQGRLLEC